MGQNAPCMETSMTQETTTYVGTPMCSIHRVPWGRCECAKPKIRHWTTRKRIEIDWDADAQVLVATSPDIPGLVLQGKDIGELMDKAKLTLPALCEELQ